MSSLSKTALQSNAERQARYRKRREQNKDARLSMFISHKARLELECLAQHHDFSRQYTLEWLLAASVKMVTSRMTPEEKEVFFSVRS